MNRDAMLIEASELLTKVDDPNMRIYDATILFFRSDSEPTAYETYQQGHIPGAAFFDHQNFSDTSSKYMYMALPEAELAAQIGNIGIDAKSEVVFYTSGILPCATRAWWILRIVGSSLLPYADLMQEMASFVPDDVLASRLKEELQYERIITYCGGGIAATVNAMAHLMAGNENVSVYDGSMSEWVGEGLPTTKLSARIG